MLLKSRAWLPDGRSTARAWRGRQCWPAGPPAGSRQQCQQGPPDEAPAGAGNNASRAGASSATRASGRWHSRPQEATAGRGRARQERARRGARLRGRSCCCENQSEDRRRGHAVLMRASRRRRADSTPDGRRNKGCAARRPAGRQGASVDCPRALTSEQNSEWYYCRCQKVTRSLETRVHKHIVTDVNSIIGDTYSSTRVTFYEHYR